MTRRSYARHDAWRDPQGVIPRALLVLCAITAEVDPKRFNKRHGSRFEPFEVLEEQFKGSFRMSRANPWLPAVVRERLNEVGAGFQDWCRNIGDDSETMRYGNNRSAGVRRLLHALHEDWIEVDRSHPWAFRGVELACAPVPLAEWAARPLLYQRMLTDMHEAFVRAVPDNKERALEAAAQRRLLERMESGKATPVTPKKVAWVPKVSYLVDSLGNKIFPKESYSSVGDEPNKPEAVATTANPANSVPVPAGARRASRVRRADVMRLGNFELNDLEQDE